MAAKEHNRPVLVKTIEFLREHVRSHALKPGDKLPALRRLSADAGVSHVTMFRALREARAAGLLVLVNKRIHVVRDPSAGDGLPRPPHAQALPVQSGPRPWERVAGAMGADIRNGVFRPGAALPSIKQLQRRYRVSYGTIGKSLARLTRDGTIQQLTNGKHTIPSLSIGAWKARIACLVGGAPDSNTVNLGQNEEQLFRSFESSCEQTGVALDTYLMFFDFERGLRRIRRRSTGRIYEVEEMALIGKDPILGFAYFTSWVFIKEDEQTLGALLRTKKPIAFLNETADFALPLSLTAPRHLRVFTVSASCAPAEAVARHLMALGHRNVAFLSADHQFGWSKMRLDGLQSAYATAGHVAAVTPFVAEIPQEVNDVIERRDFTSSAVRLPVAAGGARRNFSSLVKFMESWKQPLPAPYRAEFDAALDRMSWHTIWQAEHRLLLAPLLEQALADPAITAWVAVNDATATMALAFLKEKGVRVPADLSLISFDDSPSALTGNLSSYNFNVPAIAVAMLGYILGKKPYADADPPISGFIVNRGSTGVAGGRS